MDTLSLVVPTPAHEAAATAYVAAFSATGESLHGDSGLGRASDYAAWLALVTRTAEGNPPPGLVSADTYFGVRLSDGVLVGVINVRHTLTDYLLKHGGHIGYSIHPAYRRKGYATTMLRLALDRCRVLGIDRVLLTCDPGNIASAKTIKACGGVLENHFIDPQTGEQTLRYWVGL